MSEKQKTYVDERLRGKGTAKGRADIKSSDEKNNVEAMTADEFLTSQEFPPQGFKKEVFEEIKLLKELKKLWQKQAREEMLRKIKRLSKDVNWWDTRAIRGSSETKETDKWICRNQFKWVLKQLVEGEKK